MSSTAVIEKSLEDIVLQLNSCSDSSHANFLYKKAKNFLLELTAVVEKTPTKTDKLHSLSSALETTLKRAYYSALERSGTSLHVARAVLMHSANPTSPRSDVVRTSILKGLSNTRNRVVEEIDRVDATIGVLYQTSVALRDSHSLHFRIADSLRKGRFFLKKMKREDRISWILFFFGLLFYVLVALKILLSRVFRFRF
ncbi:hypothetical protein RCL1_001849 [Eukaryota sp. TZLM3-RCL]